MGDKNIKKETKKKKKTDTKIPVLSVMPRAVTVQPELIKKEKKPR